MLRWESILTLLFFLCAPLVGDAIAGHPLNHLDTIMLEKKKPTQLLSPLCAVKFLFASVIYKEGSRTGKQTKENNVSINASKETCVANGFSETIGSEGVTLPLHWSGLIFLSHVNCLKSFAEFHSWIRTLLLCKWLLLF